MQILIVGTDPSRIGGIETFSKNLSKLGFSIQYLTTYKIKKLDEYIVNYIFSNKWFDYLFFKLLFSVSKSLGLKFIKIKIDKLNLSYDVIIINLHYDLYVPIFKDDYARKFLVQHTQSSILKEHKLYFNNDDKIIEFARDNFEFISLSDYEKINLVNIFKLNEVHVHTIRHMSPLPIIKDKKKFNKKIIIISRFDNKIKRIDLVLEAMRLLPDYSLSVYGSGPDEIMLRKLSEPIPNVSIFGEIRDVSSVLDSHSIFVMNSENEGYGITLIEAMSRGVPIVIRDTYPSVKDAVIDNGVIIDAVWNERKFVNAIHEIERNFDEFSSNSLVLAERHSSKTIKEKWEQLLS